MPFDVNAWVLIPLLIFFARVFDVSISTMRIILMSRGHRRIVPFLGFFEMVIWLVAIRQIFQHLENPMAFIAYGAGFATGTWVGMRIEERIGLGFLAVRAIVMTDDDTLFRALSEANFGVTSFLGEGREGVVRLVYTIIRRPQLSQVVDIVNRVNPKAFLSVVEVRSTSEGVIAGGDYRLGARPFPGFIRKGI